MHETHIVESRHHAPIPVATQSYARHMHHPVPTYVANALFVPALVCLIGATWLEWNTRDAGILLLALTVFVLIGIGRLYTVKLQDRIVRLEMHVRCARVLPAAHTALWSRLSTKQVVALRFASDAELGDLYARAVHERLTPDAIKKAVREWQADYFRT